MIHESIDVRALKTPALARVERMLEVEGPSLTLGGNGEEGPALQETGEGKTGWEKGEPETLLPRPKIRQEKGDGSDMGPKPLGWRAQL